MANIQPLQAWFIHLPQLNHRLHWRLFILKPCRCREILLPASYLSTLAFEQVLKTWNVGPTVLKATLEETLSVCYYPFLYRS
jgi:hypothetical protein